MWRIFIFSISIYQLRFINMKCFIKIIFCKTSYVISETIYTSTLQFTSVRRRLHWWKFRQTSYNSLTNHSTVRFTRITYFRRYHDFRDDNDPLRKPELGHSGQYFRRARSLPPRLEKRFHERRKKKGNGGTLIGRTRWQER